MTQPSDNELMRRVQKGDSVAFETLYRRHRGRVLSFAAGLTRRPGAAEEVTQDAFLSLWNGAHRYDPSRGSLVTWLLTIVRNRGVDSVRRELKHQRVQALNEEVVESLVSVERTDELVAERERSRHVRRLVMELPVAQREVIALAFFGELSHSEIATRVQIPLGTVKGRQRLALNKLRTRAGGLGHEAATMAG